MLQLLGELLVSQCDVVLVDRDGLPHRLIQLVRLIVTEVDRCRERVAFFEGLNDEWETSHPVFQSATGTCSMTLEVIKRRPVAMID